MIVQDNIEQSRYELVVDDTVIAVEGYELRGDRIALVHTEVAQGHEGKGYAKALVNDVLADIRGRGLGVLPECDYVRDLIAKNPEAYLGLVPADARAQFGLPA